MMRTRAVVKVVSVAIGLLMVFGLVTKANADWVFKAPVITIAEDQTDFVFPVYASTDSAWNAAQVMFDFCSDTGKIHIDSLTLSGYGYFETVFDTCSTVGYAQYAFYVDSSTTGGFCYGVQWAVLVIAGYVPVTNDEAIFAVWGHIDSSVTTLDTIEIDMTEAAECGYPLEFDHVFATYPEAHEMVADLVDGMIIVQRPTAVEESKPMLDFALKSLAPIPFSDNLNIEFSIPGNCPVRVDIYDASGRLVRELLNTTLKAGVHTVSWDALDNAGRVVSQGIYFVRITSPYGTINRKVTMVSLDK